MRTPRSRCRPSGGCSAGTFRTGREILQRAIPADQIRKLCETGKTDLIPRFISKKNGRPFSAFLVLKDGKVGFEFEPRKPGAKAGGKGGFRKKKADTEAES